MSTTPFVTSASKTWAKIGKYNRQTLASRTDKTLCFNHIADVHDRQRMLETPARIEPCLFEDRVPTDLADLAVEIQRAAGDIGRGLHPESAARGIEDRGDYKRMMDYADAPRQGDRDGRGNLSEQALPSFCRWFLRVMPDQIQFSSRMFDLARLEKRYLRLIADVIEDKRAPTLMAAILRHGSLERGDAEVVLKTSERTARNTLSNLVRAGFLKSNSPKTPVRIAFPLEYRERLFPNLFADAPVA